MMHQRGQFLTGAQMRDPERDLRPSREADAVRDGEAQGV